MEKKNTLKRTETIVQPLPSNSNLSRSNTFQRTQTTTWDERFTKDWRFIGADESLSKRTKRYISYLNPSDLQLNTVTKTIQQSMANAPAYQRSLQSISDLSFKKNGVAYALDLGSRTIVAVRVEKKGKEINIQEKYEKLVTKERDLTSPDVSAYELFEACADVIAQLTPPPAGETADIAFVCSFDVTCRSKNSMVLNKWSKGLQTGRNTDDPCEDSDIAAMLGGALRRKKMPFVVDGCMNDVTAAGILGVTQLEYSDDRCVRYMMNLGTGFNIGAIDQYSEGGDVVDVSVNTFDTVMPRADFDLEVDWADGNVNANLVEKLIAGKYLGEVTRRVILKVFHADAPKLAWSRGSLPTDAVNRIAIDDSDDMAVTREIINLLWDWDVSAEQAVYVKRICYAVFVRSASLVAASLCAVARHFNGLIPALGGSVVVVSGRLYNGSPLYRDLVRSKIDTILGPILSRLLILEPVKGGSGVGAALCNLRKE